MSKNSVFRSLKQWFDRYFSDEAACALAIVLATSVFVLFFFGEVLQPVLASFIIAYLLQGVVSFFLRLKCPYFIATMFTFFIFLTTFILIVFLIFPLIWSQVIHFFNELPGMISQAQVLLGELTTQYPMLINDEQIKNITNIFSTQLGGAGKWVVSFSLSKILSIVTIMIYLVLVPVLVFFFLKDHKRIMTSFVSILPENHSLIKEVMAEMDIQIANYIRGKVIEIFIVGIADYILFIWLNLNYALLLAVLVGLSVIIPYIGAIVVTIPVVLIAFLQWGLNSDFVLLVSLYGLIQAIDGNILVPALFSEVLNLHPIIIIMAVLIFGGLWGFWGIFFAIPLATLIKAVYSAWPKKKIVVDH